MPKNNNKKPKQLKAKKSRARKSKQQNVSVPRKSLRNEIKTDYTTTPMANNYVNTTSRKGMYRLDRTVRSSVIIPSAAPFTNVASIRINPGEAMLGDWMATMSGMFQHYIIHSLTVTYIPTCSSIQPGTIMMAFDPASTDIPPTDAIKFDQLAEKVTGPVRSKSVLHVEFDQVKRFVRVSNDGEPLLVDAGIVHFAVEDCDPSAPRPGYLMIHIKLDLLTPQPTESVAMSHGATSSYSTDGPLTIAASDYERIPWEIEASPNFAHMTPFGTGLASLEAPQPGWYEFTRPFMVDSKVIDVLGDFLKGDGSTGDLNPFVPKIRSQKINNNSLGGDILNLVTKGIGYLAKGEKVMSRITNAGANTMTSSGFMDVAITFLSSALPLLLAEPLNSLHTDLYNANHSVYMKKNLMPKFENQRQAFFRTYAEIEAKLVRNMLRLNKARITVADDRAYEAAAEARAFLTTHVSLIVAARDIDTGRANLKSKHMLKLCKVDPDQKKSDQWTTLSKV